MLDAYHPPRSKYSLCCSVPGRVPQPWLGEVPHPDLAKGGTPVLCWPWEYPSPVLTMGIPETGDPGKNLGLGCPCPERTLDQWPGKEPEIPLPQKGPGKEPGTGVPPPRCGQMDTCENSTFPILQMWEVTMFLNKKLLCFKTSNYNVLWFNSLNCDFL